MVYVSLMHHKNNRTNLCFVLFSWYNISIACIVRCPLGDSNNRCVNMELYIQFLVLFHLWPNAVLEHSQYGFNHVTKTFQIKYDLLGNDGLEVNTSGLMTYKNQYKFSTKIANWMNLRSSWFEFIILPVSCVPFTIQIPWCVRVCVCLVHCNVCMWG